MNTKAKRFEHERQHRERVLAVAGTVGWRMMKMMMFESDGLNDCHWVTGSWIMAGVGYRPNIDYSFEVGISRVPWI